MTDKNILIVDDDKNICMMLSLYLHSEGFTVDVVHDGEAALKSVSDSPPSLVLLDVMMPGMDGFETLSRLRTFSQVPVIFLTARDLTEDVVRGFEGGADDYIVKPCEPRELLARIKARLRSESTPAEAEGKIVSVGAIQLDIARYRVTVGGKVIEGLKPREVQLLQFLMKNKNIVFSRERLLTGVWGYDAAIDTRTVDVHIKSLRQALGEEGKRIRTVWGVGYKLEEDQ